MNSKQPWELKANENMQETTKYTRVSRCTRCCPKEGAEPIGYKKRNRRASEKTPATVNNTGNDYLKQTFENILASKVGICLRDFGAEAKDSVYLYESVENYFRLMNMPFNIVSSGFFELDAFNLYHALRKILPETLGINFDVWKGKISIILFDDDIKFPDYTLFYIPVCGIENMSEQLRTAYLHFLSFVRQTQKIDIPSENRDFEYIVSEYGEEFEEEEEWKNFTDMRKRYDSGDIGTIMADISKTEIIEADLESQLNKLLAEDNTHGDEGLISIMLSGIRLLRQDCIFNYDYCPDTDNYNSYYTEMVDFNRGFCFCWGNENNDPVVNMVIEFYNNDQQELGTYGPATFIALTPDSDRLFERSDFPTRFGKWYSAFYEELENYMSNGTENE